jgi:cytoskeletal protein CcmA (bactofilin family)
MREERGQISGDVVVYEPYTLWGSIGGDVKVIKGGKFYVRGNVYGNLLVEEGGRVHIFGNILGDVTVEPAAKVIHSGIIGGDAINNGGRLYVEAASKIQGKIKTRKGAETTIEPQHRKLE